MWRDAVTQNPPSVQRLFKVMCAQWKYGGRRAILARRSILSVPMPLLLWPIAVRGQSPEHAEAVKRYVDLYSQARYQGP